MGMGRGGREVLGAVMGVRRERKVESECEVKWPMESESCWCGGRREQGSQLVSIVCTPAMMTYSCFLLLGEEGCIVASSKGADTQA